MEAKKFEPFQEIDNFFEIRIGSVAPSRPLAFDLYLLVADKPVLFRRRGDKLTFNRVQSLYTHGGETFLIPRDQREDYLRSIREMIDDPGCSRELRCRFIKESAFIHVHDLFTKQDVGDVVESASELIGEMVNFVSSDIAAVVSLLGLSRHDYYTYNHCVDVAVYSIVLAQRAIGDDKETMLQAGLGGLLHDIGKRELDYEIINKSTPLTTEEWQKIKQHPENGNNLLDEVPHVPDVSKRVVLEHHENFDGSGYPYGCQGEEICKLSRIVMIADVFDALTTDRSYHKKISPTEALDTMYGMQPGKFDPSIFKSFNAKFADKKPKIQLSPKFDPCRPGAMRRFTIVNNRGKKGK